MRKRKNHPLTPAGPAPCPPCQRDPPFRALPSINPSPPAPPARPCQLLFLTGTRPGFRDLQQRFLPLSPCTGGSGMGPGFSPAASPPTPTQGAAGSSGAEPTAVPLARVLPGRKGGKVLLAPSPVAVKGSNQPRAGRFLPLPPGKGCKSQEATTGWSWPRGYFYRCPLPFPRAECSHRDNPGPSIPSSSPGGSERGTGGEGEGAAAPAGPPDPRRGTRGNPQGSPGSPQPLHPSGSRAGWRAGHSPAQAEHSGDKAPDPGVRGDPAPGTSVPSPVPS